MQQTAVDFQPHNIDTYGALYLFYTALWKNRNMLRKKTSQTKEE